MKNWRDGPPTPKRYEKMPMTVDHFYKVIGMRDELIFEQKNEISKLKTKVNKLELQLEKHKNSQ